MRSDLIAKQFSQAASSYQEYDLLQRQSAQQLQAGMQASGVMLDIGCGPGTAFVSDEIKQVIALDIAAGMLKQLTQRFPNYFPLCADAQALPLADNSINTIYSNLALQWCENFPQAVKEFERVLAPAGECHLAIVTAQSLELLSKLGLRVNQFDSAEKFIHCFDLSRWQLDYQLQPLTVHFDSLKSLLYSIKGVGASVNTSVLGENALGESTLEEKALGESALEENTLLRGRQDWLKLVEKAELMREPQGLPLSYQILFIHGKLKG